MMLSRCLTRSSPALLLRSSMHTMINKIGVRSLATVMAEAAENATCNHREILEQVDLAQNEFSRMNQHNADRIFDAVAKAANEQRLPLAKLAANETKMGCFEDKVLKNGLACELIHDRYKDSKTCGLIQSDPMHGTYTYASPAGPVCAITPVTNPTSTAIAKCLMMAKTRNAGIFLPHPRASESTAAAVQVCAEAGEKAGAPKGWVQCILHPTMEDSRSIMQSEQVRLILSTGGPSVVKASYTSGKPALGVGGGNAPVLVDETADLPLACGSIVLGKTFDNGVICAAEQSVVVVDEVYEEFKKLLEDRGVLFLTGQDRDKLATFFHKEDGHINPDVVGQTAPVIAERAGLNVQLPESTCILATEESIVGPENPLSAEKLSPILSVFRAADFDKALDLCAALASHGGIGHTAGIYTRVASGGTTKRTEQFVERVPVGRVFVNAPTSISAIGSAFNFYVDPSFTLGVGTKAGSSVSSNVGPMHLINTTTVAERQPHMEWFNLPKRLFFNRGCLEEALNQCSQPDEYGRRTERAMIVTDKGMLACGHVERVVQRLESLGYVVDIFDDVLPDPDMECVRKGVKACEQFKPDIMFCLGGGSPMDAGKFIRVQYEHPELSVSEAATRFLELRKRTTPFPQLGSKIRQLVAIPTTSGTGSEVSPFTVITDDDGLKYPIASYKLTPDVAICDSTLCDGLPKSLIANAGIDAVTHAIEAYVSVVHNDFTKQNALEALNLLFKNLPESYDKGTQESRDAVHRGATLAGIAFSNSFLGICHSLAHRVGAEFHLPHGMTNAVLLPHVIRYNSSDRPVKMGIYPSYKYPKAKKHYSQIAKEIEASEETTEGLIEALYKLNAQLDLPTSFKDAGVNEDDFMKKLDQMSEGAFDDQCTPANPRFPLVTELRDILIAAYNSK